MQAANITRSSKKGYGKMMIPGTSQVLTALFDENKPSATQECTRTSYRPWFPQEIGQNFEESPRKDQNADSVGNTEEAAQYIIFLM